MAPHDITQPQIFEFPDSGIGAKIRMCRETYTNHVVK